MGEDDGRGRFPRRLAVLVESQSRWNRIVPRPTAGSPSASPVSVPSRELGDAMRPSNFCRKKPRASSGIVTVKSRSRCTAVPYTVPVTATVPHGPASAHQSPVPETVDPETIRFISKELPGTVKSSVQRPTMSRGPRESEQAPTNRVRSKTDVMGRRFFSGQGWLPASISYDCHRIAI